MRIAISVGAGMCLALVASPALAQPTPPTQPLPAKAGGAGSSALAVPETPPAPPAPGTGETQTPKPPAAAPQSFGDETGMTWKPGTSQEPLAGWHDMFFVRDADDNFRLSPHALLQLDFNSFLGIHNGSKAVAAGGAGMPPRFFVRRFRAGVGGEFLRRWTYEADVDFAQTTDNPAGLDELFAARPGVAPTASTARYKAIQGAAVAVNLADIFINYSLCPCLNFQFGQYRPPVGMESRTDDWQTTFMERSLAVRGFVVPANRETGLMLWGDIGDKLFSYELMVTGGDGQNRPEVDGTVDWIGRLMTKPLQSIKLLKDTEIGISARHGDRDQDGVGYNYPEITSGQGFILWNPSYVDSAGRDVKVIPSGAQNLIGGELRLPIGPLDIRGEGYYVANHTREAVDGFQFTNTERLGTVKGGAFYAQATLWFLGDSNISGDPGYMRPEKLNLKRKQQIKRGPEVSALFSGIVGDYVGNSRLGAADPNTPGGSANPATKFKIYQFAAEASYWHSKWVRMTLNYSFYLTPGSGSAANAAAVPANVFGTPDNSQHFLHELGLRLQLWM